MAYLNQILAMASASDLGNDNKDKIMQTALALSIAHPFDTDEKVVDPHQNQYSILEAALLIGARENFNAPVIDWPRDIAGFNARLLDRGAQVNAEWFAASLIAQGVNPWDALQDKPEELPRVVEMAIEKNMPGLVARLLECGGAWSAQKIMDAKRPPRSRLDNNSIWDLTQSSWSTGSIEVLLNEGARLKENAVEILSNARVEMVKVLAPFVEQEISDKGISKIIQAWQEQRQSNLITSQHVENMAKWLWPNKQLNGTSRSEVEMKRLFDFSWGSRANGSFGHAYDFLTNTGPEALCAVHTNKSVLAGKWSLLAAAAFSRIKMSSFDGPLGWSTGNMLMLNWDKQKQKWERANCERAPFKGSLKSALGFDIRPGIKVDGIVALSLFSQLSDYSSQNSSAPSEDRKNHQEVFRYIREFGLTAGIEDVPAWARLHMSDAAEFTNAVLGKKKLTSEAFRCMQDAWCGALDREPSLAAGLSDGQAAQLITSLFNRDLLVSASREKLLHICRALSNGLNASSFMEDSALSGERRELALALHLVQKPMAWAFDPGYALSTREIEMMREFIEKNPVGVEDMVVAHLDQMDLALKTKSVPSARRGPRL